MWLKEEEDAAIQQTSRQEHSVPGACKEELSVEEQAVASGRHEDDGNTHKRQQREHTSFRSNVDEMFPSLLGPYTDGQQLH